MNDPQPLNEQTHPLYISDRSTVDRLLGKTSPETEDFIDLARLFIRYEGFQGAFDIQEDLLKTLRAWGLSREDLNKKSRKLWEEGYRPGKFIDDSVGSGFDTSNTEEK